MPHGVATLAVGLAFLVAGCGGDEPEKESRDEVPEAYADLPDGCPTPTDPGPHEYDAALHDELMAMFERDQSGRTGGPDEEGDPARTERLKEILGEHGWPSNTIYEVDWQDPYDIASCSIHHRRPLWRRR